MAAPQHPQIAGEKPVLIVTGASGGIGAATALLGARRGYAVCVHYFQNRDGADAVVHQIQDEGGAGTAIQADVGSEADVVDLFESADRVGRLAALVNNAATLETQARLDTFDAARLERMFRTNVIGSFLCAREAVRRMSTRQGGRGGAIVNVSSLAAKYGSPGEYIDYAATKGAIDTMTVGLTREVAAEGIRVNAVRPGYIYTNLHARGGEPNRVERLKSSVPMQRGGNPEEVAAAILWLLSDEASFVTGSILDVAGGR